MPVRGEKRKQGSCFMKLKAVVESLKEPEEQVDENRASCVVSAWEAGGREEHLLCNIREN